MGIPIVGFRPACGPTRLRKLRQVAPVLPSAYLFFYSVDIILTHKTNEEKEQVLLKKSRREMSDIQYGIGTIGPLGKRIINFQHKEKAVREIKHVVADLSDELRFAHCCTSTLRSLRDSSDDGAVLDVGRSC